MELKVSSDEQLAFDDALVEAKTIDEHVSGTLLKSGHTVAWAPQPGFQVDMLSCPVFELLGHGNRGGGKTAVLVAAFGAHVQRGFGDAWQGVIFRNTYPQLADVVSKAQAIFRQVFPQARFNRGKMVYEWPSGEKLFFRHINTPDHYWNYHGFERPFIGFEELTNWPTDECFVPMFSLCRTSRSGVPLMVRSTTNPYGVGHNWIKQRYRLAGQWWRTIVVDDAKDAEGHPEPMRVSMPSRLIENKALLQTNPDYARKVSASATNKAMKAAWVDGSWDVQAGGMFDEVYSPQNVVRNFRVPHSWPIYRNFDWGSAKPFCVLWVARSDGTDLQLQNGGVMPTVRGDLFILREWYGSTGRPNEGCRMLATEVAKGIIKREIMWGWRTRSGTRVRPGAADSAIYNVENGVGIANDMLKPVSIDGVPYPGANFVPADKSPGSRKTGWEKCRVMLAQAHKDPGVPRELPGLFVVGEACPNWLRTVPSLPRDDKDLDDVNTDAEDHAGDTTRYAVRLLSNVSRSGQTVGLTY